MRGVVGQLAGAGVDDLNGRDGRNGHNAQDGQGAHLHHEVTVIDMEASIEHLSRGTLRYVDLLLVVVEPYYRAMETAGRTVRFARELKIPRLLGVANKVRTSQDEAAIRQYCAAQDLEIATVVPFDEQVTEADRTGQAVIDAAPGAAAVQAIAALVPQIGI